MSSPASVVIVPMRGRVKPGARVAAVTGDEVGQVLVGQVVTEWVAHIDGVRGEGHRGILEPLVSPGS